MECKLCGGIPRIGTEPPCCSACGEMLQTHTAHICYGCNQVYWMPKTPENVMFLAETRGIPPQQIMSEAVYFEMSHCKRCLAPARHLSLVKESKWTN